MPRMKLTMKAIDALKARTKTGKPQLFWDHGDHKDVLPGFGVLVSGKTTTCSYVVQRDLSNGRTRRITIGNVNELDLATARQRAGEILQAMRQGKDPKAKNECNTLREALTTYRKAHEHRLRTSTDKDYEDIVTRHLGDWLDRPMAEITREMVETRHKAIAEEVQNTHRTKALESAKAYEAKAKKVENGWPDAAADYRALAENARNRKPYSGHATANGAMRALRLLWNFATDKNKSLGPNPVKLNKQWFKVRRRTRLVKADDLPRFWDAVQKLEPLWRDYVALLLYSGLRRDEAASLRWTDIDLRAKLLRIPATETKADRKLDLPLSDVLLDMFVARRALGDATFVFPANSESGHVEEPRFAFDLVAETCGVRVSPHDLRRTFCTVAESCDISPVALKALINHSLGSDVTEGYIIMMMERLRAPMQKVTDKLKEYCGVAVPAGGNIVSLRS
jgi:integrase